MAWVKEMRAATKYPIICANDSAGGAGYKGIGRTVQGLIMGAANDEGLSYKPGYNQRESALAGINWLWSPYMADIVRPAAGDKEILINQSRAFIRGMQDAGLAAMYGEIEAKGVSPVDLSIICGNKEE